MLVVESLGKRVLDTDPSGGPGLSFRAAHARQFVLGITFKISCTQKMFIQLLTILVKVLISTGPLPFNKLLMTSLFTCPSSSVSPSSISIYSFIIS